eukprot:4462063-Amphidinium_carterae.1
MLQSFVATGSAMMISLSSLGNSSYDATTGSRISSMWTRCVPDTQHIALRPSGLSRDLLSWSQVLLVQWVPQLPVVSHHHIQVIFLQLPVIAQGNSSAVHADFLGGFGPVARSFCGADFVGLASMMKHVFLTKAGAASHVRLIFAELALIVAGRAANPRGL